MEKKFDKALKFIDKYNIPQSALANLLGLNKSGISRKISGSVVSKEHAYADQFTEIQKTKIIEYLKGMKKDLLVF